MNKKGKKIIKIIVTICIIILLIDAGVLFYSKFIYKPKKSYFDSINSFEITNKGYISVGSNNDNNKGYEKAKITKYNNEKEKTWEKLYNKGYNSCFFGIKQDDKDYIAVGSYESTKKENKEKLKSALIVKYDENGNLLAESKFQVLGNSKFSNVLVMDDGYLVVGQSIYENMTLGLSDEGGAFLIKYDKNLKMIWKTNYGGSKSGIYNDLLVKNNYIYTVGKDASRVGIISKYTMDGEGISTSNYEYTDTFGFTSIVNIDDHLFAVGSKKVTEDKNDYNTDALIVKYNLDCEQISDKTYIGKGMERYNRAIVDDNNNIVIAGQTGVLNKKKSTSSKNVFSYDGLFAKYDKNLKELEVDNYGDEKDDYFTDIKEKDSNYIISDYSTYENENYLSKFITYTNRGKLIEVE